MGNYRQLRRCIRYLLYVESSWFHTRVAWTSHDLRRTAKVLRGITVALCILLYVVKCMWKCIKLPRMSCLRISCTLYVIYCRTVYFVQQITLYHYLYYISYTARQVICCKYNNNINDIFNYVLYIVQYIMNNIVNELITLSEHYNTIHYTIQTVHCTRYTVHYIMYGVQYITQNELIKKYSTKHTMN